MGKPVLAYWDTRGLAASIRYMLEYLNVEFEDKFYVVGPAPTYQACEWFDVKHSLGFDFPNLPYYVDDDIKLTQSDAIMRYIGRKHDSTLLGKSAKDQSFVDMLACQAGDCHGGYYKGAYDPSAKKEEFAGLFRDKLKLFSNYLGDKKWFVGEYLTFPDFHIYELLEVYEDAVPGIISEFSNLKAFWERFKNIPQIKAYLTSTRFHASPINNRMAQWGV